MEHFAGAVPAKHKAVQAIVLQVAGQDRFFHIDKMIGGAILQLGHVVLLGIILRGIIVGIELDGK